MGNSWVVVGQQNPILAHASKKGVFRVAVVLAKQAGCFVPCMVKRIEMIA